VQSAIEHRTPNTEHSTPNKMIILKSDKLVKSLHLCHSRAGGNPEHIEITRSKSTLSPACAGMTKNWRNVVFATPSNIIGIKIFEFLFIENIVNRAHITLHIENIGLCIICGAYYPDLFLKLVYKFVDNIVGVGKVPKSP
jgi:hypothetical protein